jgi:hypothetical protein
MTRFRRCLFLLSLMLYASACRAPAKPVPHDTIVWKPLGEWSGRNLMQTEAFISDSGSLRIAWEARSQTAPGEGVFKITLHSGVSGRPLLEAVNHKGPGREVAFVTEDPREFFLVIESSNLDWTVAVSEAVQATTTPHTKR